MKNAFKCYKIDQNNKRKNLDEIEALLLYYLA